VVADKTDGRIPASARNALRILVAELAALDLRVTRLETKIVARAKTDAVARRLATIPGIGPIIASRLSAMVPDPSIFRSARDFAAWIGLVPRQSSTGGKPRLGGISKRGNASLRRLLVGGARAAMFRSKALQNDPWLSQLRARKPVMVAAVASANKIARAIWAVMRRNAVGRPAAARSSSRPHQHGPTGHARRLKAHVLTAVKTMPLYGGGLRPVLTAVPRSAPAEPGWDEETVF
jgi:transposase